MNTKKAQWLKRPENYIKTDLHTFSWNENDSSSVFWTIGEEGSISLSVDSDNGVSFSFVLLHTPFDTITFGKDGIYSSFFGLDSFVPTPISSRLKMSKFETKISFSTEEKTILEIENPAFAGSASFGLIVSGKGEISLSVF